MKVFEEERTVRAKNINLVPLIKGLFPTVGHELSCSQLLWQLAKKIYGADAAEPGFCYFTLPKELAEINRVLAYLIQQKNRGFQLVVRFVYFYGKRHDIVIKRTR